MDQQQTLFRRLVVVDENERSKVISDGASPDVRTDPARPGLTIAAMWATDRTPARLDGVREGLSPAHILVPPPGGSTCRVVSFPPEADLRGKVDASDVARFFASLGAPGISTFSPGAPHPYMQKSETLEFAIVIEGEITLVLDTEEVQLAAGDTVVQRGTNHAWSNRSRAPCLVAFTTHDARA